MRAASVVWLWVVCAHPVVKWAQSPAKLFLTFLVPDVQEEDVEVDHTSVRINPKGRKDMAANLHLLRAINESTAVVKIHKSTVEMTLAKIRDEPCWLRLIKSEKAAKKAKWLKRDVQKARPEECQHYKEMWREAYFRMKLEGKKPEETLTGDAEDENDKPDDGGSDPKAAERVQFQKRIEALRAKATPRNAKKAKKAKKSR
jgi:hypothetical protein